MQKRTKKPFLSLRGSIDEAAVTDRGVRYIGYDSRGDDLSVDANEADMAVNAGGRVILVEGGYLERDDNGRKYLMCDRREGDCIDFKVDDEGHFTLDYYREQA